MKDDSPHPDDFVSIAITMMFQAKTTVSDHPVDFPTEYSYCLPCDEYAADYLESIARAIRERRAFGFMQQEIAALPVGTGEWVQQTLSDMMDPVEMLHTPGIWRADAMSDCDHPPHWHCPNDCEKPQPYDDEGKRWCGRCLYEGRGQVEVFFCTPETCDEG